MKCQQCGASLAEEARFCKYCGASQEANRQVNPSANNHLIGYSDQINDPALARYLKNSNRWSLLFASLLAVAAVIGFFIYGENSTDMDNPQALYIGLGIGGMFMVIALLQVIGRSRSTTWDGAVVDKQVERKGRRRRHGNNDYCWQNYTEYTVTIRSDQGKIHTIRVEDDDTVYNYYQIGDRVRHHKGLNFEKYDKSRDTIIFCNACASLNDINDDYCHRCHCPLLK